MVDEMKVKKVAVLIDAENISYRYAQLILNEAANIGNVICKRIYGDWSLPTLTSWKKPIMDYSINAVQQFRSVSGKNSSDSVLIIDAMDMLHDEKYHSICIVSSDGDFTRLASRLRESEIFVVGMGEQKTPASFRSACDKFLYLDVLSKNNSDVGKEKTDQQKNTVKNKETVETDFKADREGAQRLSIAEESQDTSTDVEDQKKNDNEDTQSGLNIQIVTAAINEIIDAEADDDGWAGLANVGNKLNAKISDFDVRNFGCERLSQFINNLGTYDVKRDGSPANPNHKVIYIKKKIATELGESVAE